MYSCDTHSAQIDPVGHRSQSVAGELAGEDNRAVGHYETSVEEYSGGEHAHMSAQSLAERTCSNLAGKHIHSSAASLEELHKSVRQEGSHCTEEPNYQHH